ncbi:MAG TPA: hypothetical protein VIY73_04135 [Polyangiaceae bacterium]
MTPPDEAERHHEAGLGGARPALTAGQKRRTAKLRSGGDDAILRLRMPAKHFGVESTVLQADEMLLALANARALKRLKESAPELLAPGLASKT